MYMCLIANNMRSCTGYILVKMNDSIHNTFLFVTVKSSSLIQ